jgi:hypothetical protein
LHRALLFFLFATIFAGCSDDDVRRETWSSVEITARLCVELPDLLIPAIETTPPPTANLVSSEDLSVTVVFYDWMAGAGHEEVPTSAPPMHAITVMEGTSAAVLALDDGLIGGGDPDEDYLIVPRTASLWARSPRDGLFREVARARFPDSDWIMIRRVLNSIRACDNL